MLVQLIAEATECDFKKELERKKPKSWLKSVSAFANGIGGTLFFGVANETSITGLDHIQEAAEYISEAVKTRIVPLPNITLIPQRQNEKDFLALVVKPGRATPYYYSADGIRQAYIRLGNESIPAPEHILHELILRGTNQTYDVVSTSFRKDDYSFTLLEENQQENISKRILEFCAVPRSKREIAGHMELKDLRHFTSRYLKPLLDKGAIQMTIPSTPRHRNQKYVTKNKNKAGD